MKRTGNVPFPVIGLIAATRALLGAGIALLIADRLTPARRKQVGQLLLGVGVASTIPLMATVIRSRRSTRPAESDRRLYQTGGA